MGLPLTIYRTLRPVFGRGIVGGENPDSRDPRPEGTLIWIHAPHFRDRSVVEELIEEFLVRNPNYWFLVTNFPADPWDLPHRCFHDIVPLESKSQTSQFIDHWKPDLVCWLAGQLRPELINQSANSSVPHFLVDTGSAIEATTGLRYWPGLAPATLKHFQQILVGDLATQTVIKSVGIPSKRIEVSGVLERGDDALLCNEAERDTIAKLLDSRPVWLAAGINVAEAAPVLAAHKQVMRRSHRMLLIIVPEDPENADNYSSVLETCGMDYSRRSAGDEPESDTQIYLADAEGELGLWYRLAPVSFIGQTLAGRSGEGPNPFDAAALGSVVLHGPGLAPHQNAFRRLARAGASKQVAHSGELALSVEALLAPDKAAEMAHAAWQISTAGAEVMERVIELIEEALDIQEIPE